MFVKPFCLFLILLDRIQGDKKHLTDSFCFEIAASNHAPYMVYVKLQFLGGFGGGTVTN